MDVAGVLSGVKDIQTALQMLAVLNLTHYENPLPVFPDVAENTDYDMIVVGGGTAGCLVASRLSEVEEFKVLLIEAGGIPEFETTVPALMTMIEDVPADYNYTNQPEEFVPILHKNKRFHMNQGKMLGGTDRMNYMLYIRGEPKDYNDWAKIVGDDDWKYDNVLPYFKKTENLTNKKILASQYGAYHGTKGKMKVEKMFNNITLKYYEPLKQMGLSEVLDTNTNYTLGFTQPLVTAADGARQSSCHSYLRHARYRPNLDVLYNAQVIKILIESKKAIGVKVLLSNDETKDINVKKEVIVTAGAFNTAKLLLLSGIGPADDLKKLNIDLVVDLPVGKGLSDHRMSPLVFPALKTSEPTLPQDPYKVPVSLVTGFVALDKKQTFADYEFVMIVNPNNSPALTQLTCFTFKYLDKICKLVANAVVNREVLFTFIDHLVPVSRGYVTLKSNNPKDDPLVYLGYYSNKTDLVNHARYAADFSRIVNTEYFKSIDGEMLDISNCSQNFVYNSTEFWQCYIERTARTVWHYCCTAAMGSVLDSKLRVNGVPNIRVGDTSMMPHITSGNTAAPTYMIAEKVSDMIKEANGVSISNCDDD